MYDRTYSRTKADGTRETWPETVDRVVHGNLALVYGDDERTWTDDVLEEQAQLRAYMLRFAILPAGRHIWATGVKGAQFLFNCHVAGWGTSNLSRHYSFEFLRLMEGGGVGANYSATHIESFGTPRRELDVHIVCDPEHDDYQEMKDAGILSEKFDADWHGAFPVEDSREGWAEAMVDLMDTFMTDDEVKHRDRVYDVSRVRKKGSRLKTFGGTASGPQPFGKMLHTFAEVLNQAAARGFIARLGFRAADAPLGGLRSVEAMELDHAIAECVVSGGVRRSARMAIVHWLDPDVFEFIACKQNSGKHWTTNISVEIDAEFTHALEDESNSSRAHAQQVHRAVVTGMLSNGEPGYWNSTLSNHGEVNRVIATNPCGEIALPSAGACVLAHVNMEAFAPTRKGGPIDILGLLNAHRLTTRFAIRATYGDMLDAEQKAIMDSERRVGVGHFGVQGFLAKMGIRYSEAPYGKVMPKLLRELYQEVRAEARNYAFALRIPEPVKVTTVAPTGTIAKMPGVTEGIHPLLFRFFERRVRFSMVDDNQWQQAWDLQNAGYKTEVDVYDKSGNTIVVVFPTKERLVEEVEALGYDADVVEIAEEISVRDMLAFQAMYQTNYADNAVSFTVNVEPEPHQQAALSDPANVDAIAWGTFVMPAPTEERVDEVSEILADYLPSLKGTTLMLNGARPQAPYTKMSEAEYDAAILKGVGDGVDEDCATGACPVR